MEILKVPKHEQKNICSAKSLQLNSREIIQISRIQLGDVCNQGTNLWAVLVHNPQNN